MKKQHLTLLVTVLITVLLLTTSIFSQSSDRNFYLNLLKEGKNLYLTGDYRGSLENFRISEFGLYEEKERLQEVYLYYALANYKLNRGNDAFTLVEKLKSISGTKNLEDISIPAELQGDINILFSSIDKNYNKRSLYKNKSSKISHREIKPSLKNKKKLLGQENFKDEFVKVRKLLHSNNLKGAKKGIKNLKKLKKNDIRITFLNGILLFRDKKYKRSISELTKVSKLKAFGLSDEAGYYLSLSHYFEKNYGQAIAYYQKIEKKDFKEKLETIITKVKKEREARINNIIKSNINKKIFNEFADNFRGDIYIALDILKKMINGERIIVKNITNLVTYSLKNPNIYEIKFILLSSEFFTKKNDLNNSISILKRSKFFRSEIKDNIDIFYDLGILYYKQKEYRKSFEMMTKVNKLHKNYKNVKFYLTNKKR
ncbi:MAG: hypothetical protein ABFR75_14285 [Acidobacteriota bacterium]